MTPDRSHRAQPSHPPPRLPQADEDLAPAPARRRRRTSARLRRPTPADERRRAAPAGSHQRHDVMARISHPASRAAVSVQRPDGVRRHICLVSGCGHSFSSKQGLLRHQQIHSAPHRCRHCQYFRRDHGLAHVGMAALRARSRSALSGWQAGRRSEEPGRALPALAQLTDRPSGRTLLRGLAQVGFMHAPELGLVLGLPAGFLLSLLPDSRRLVHRLLQAALPLDLPQLAAALRGQPLAAHSIARDIDLLAQEEAGRLVTRSHVQMLDRLQQLLMPLACESVSLGLALGLARHTVLTVDAGARQRYTLDELLQVLRRHEAIRAEHDLPLLSYSQWLDAIARAGAPCCVLEELARYWLVPVPAPWSDWHACALSYTDTHSLSAELVERCAGQADARVPLQQLWPLVRRYVDRPLFVLALEEADTAEALGEIRFQNTGLIGLLRRAVASGTDTIAWTCLLRLARCQCIEPSFVTRLPPATAGQETVSRPLHPCDLVRLVDIEQPEREALEVAVVLGIGQDYGALQGRAVYARAEHRALHIWLRLGAGLAGLQTGHLVELFNQLGKPALVQRLTGHQDSRPGPDPVPLVSLCPRLPRLLALSRLVRQQPGWAQTFAARHQLERRSSYLAPQGTGTTLRLLNSLALDLRLQELFEHFVTRCQEDYRNRPFEQERTAAGYPDAFRCPVSLDYMEDPVAIPMPAGLVTWFSRATLLASLQAAGHINPVTRSPLRPEDVPDVDAVHRERIRAWRRQHPELEETGEPYTAPDDNGN